MPVVTPRLNEPRPLRRLGHEWKGTLPVILLSRTTRLIAGGAVRLDAQKLYCLPTGLAHELLAEGIAIPGEPTDAPA